MTGLPEQPLRATAMNALAHGADALYGAAREPGLRRWPRCAAPS